MRFLFILFLAVSVNTFAQSIPDDCKNVQDIAWMERLNHERLSAREQLTLASNNFDVKYYRLEWEVDPAVWFIKGKVTVYYIITSPTNFISLDLVNTGMNVDSVKQRNTTLVKQHSNDVLQINFPATIGTGVFDSLSIYYKGAPPNTGFGSFIQSTHAGAPIIWTLSEPYGARDWWPCKNGLDDKADSIDVLITTPAAYKAASNGLLQSETLINGGVQKITWWKHRYPIASYLVCMATTNYATFNNSVQLGSVTLPMQTFCYPESLASFQANTPLVLNALQLYHNLFGDYPFIKEKYGHVQFGWGGGMEHQTSTFITNAGENLMAHELAHQWFGDKVTCGSWQDIWLNEGFATHLASIYFENKFPLLAVPTRKAEINTITSSATGSVWVDDTSSVGRIFDSRLSYSKGSHLLYMLRWILGDSVFFRGCKQYLQDPKLAYGFARTDDLKRNLEQVSGKDLTKFFTDWYRGQGYPSYNVQWTQLGNSHVRIKMNQTSSHPSVSFFALPVALKFKNSTQEKTIVVDNKSNGELFIKNIGFVADTVIVDPDAWLITRNNTTQKVIDAASGQNVLQIYPNPFNDRFYIYLRNFAASTAHINLFNSNGQLMAFRNVSFLNGSEFIEMVSEKWSSGVYVVRVEADNGFKVSKQVLKMFK